jgi:hypothetical protein
LVIDPPELDRIACNVKWERTVEGEMTYTPLPPDLYKYIVTDA